jgi:penicillin amidase
VTRRRTVRLALAGIAALVVVGLVAVTVLTFVFVRRPFPDHDGEVALPGLRTEVLVRRDDRGVPQIYADDPEGLFRAQGYVHAQDRFFEMDLRRRVAAGRLAELVGDSPDAVRSDVVARTLGWRITAERELELASPSTRAVLDAYAAGVNDYLRGRSPSQLSLGYTMIGMWTRLPRIEPWTALDSLTWLKAMSWDLRSGGRDELDRARIFATVEDVTRVNQLFPGYPYQEHRPIVDVAADSPPRRPARRGPSDDEDPSGFTWALGTDGAQTALRTARQALEALPELLASGREAGSNSWVVSGRLTATGKPFLANDVHLTTSAPGVWYQVGLHCRPAGDSCPYDVAGYSVSGVPGVLTGHNATVAWGITGANVDVTDYYLEALVGGSYLRDGRMVPLDSREEVIQVADGAPVRFSIRSTRHGPLLSDVAAPPDDGPDGPDGDADEQRPERAPERGSGYGVSVAWSALRPGRSMDAILDMDAAGSVQELRAAARKISAPAQDIVYAGVDGHFGYQAVGLVPRRGTPAVTSSVPADGSWPQPGWDSGHDWDGYLKAEDLPSIADPGEGFLVAANQAMTRTDADPLVTGSWDYGYRSQRIRALIVQAVAQGRRMQISDMTAIQTDTYNGMARELVPLLLEMKVDPFTRQGQDLLRGWDYTQPAGSAAAAYFNAVWATLLEHTFADEMPEETGLNGGGRWFEVVNRLLDRPKDSWWDDRRTPNLVEARDEILRRSLVDARLMLTSRLGKDPDRWRWGRPHRVELTPRPVASDIWPGAIRWLVDIGPHEVGGGSSVVSAFAWDVAGGTFTVVSAPSLRMVVDLGSFDRSRWVNQTGASGHPGNGHYDDQFDTWLEGHSYPWAFSEPAVRARVRDELRLVPSE